MKKIYDILLNETKHDRFLDKDSLEEILDELMKINSCDGIKLKMEEDYKSTNFGSYLHSEKRIILNPNAIIGHSDELGTYHEYTLFLFNLEILFNLLHEFEHFKQNRFYLDNDYYRIKDRITKLEFMLIELNEDYWLSNYNKLKREYKDDDIINEKWKLVREKYDKYHDLFPKERMADIKAINCILSTISNNDNCESRREIGIDWYNSLLYSYYLYGYEENNKGEIINPVANFNQKLNIEFKDYYLVYMYVSLLNKNNLLTDEIRLTYGLPISNILYKDTENKFMKYYGKKIYNKAKYKNKSR